MTSVHKVAPDGARVSIDVPDELTDLSWIGFTKISGPGFVHTFRVGAVEELDIIDRRLLPGARVQRWQRPGYELRLYQARDASNNALVWAGRYHGITLWLGGPAPTERVIGRIERAVRFQDDPDGAVVAPRSRALYRRESTLLTAVGSEVRLIARPVGDGAALPRWRGASHPTGEMWRAPLALDDAERRRLGDTPYAWRYLIANPTAIVDVVFRPPFPPAVPQADTARMERILTGLAVFWRERPETR